MSVNVMLFVCMCVLNTIHLIVIMWSTVTEQSEPFQRSECIDVRGSKGGLVNNMWYRLLPAEAPVFQRNAADEETAIHSRLPQTGFMLLYI